MGFQYASATDPVYGAIGFYAPSAAATAASVITVKSGSKLVFLNDDQFLVNHTASGLGTTGFPSFFTNTSGATQSGSTIDGGTTWSTGNLDEGQMSQVFTVGPPAAYYFGCVYHYSRQVMRDVIVSTK